MNSLLETIFIHGLLLDTAGIVGLGLLSLAAIKLSRRNQTWGGVLLAAGALSLLVARIYLVLAPHFMSHEVLHSIGPVGIRLVIALPPVLLAFGLAGVVWGLWGHERWLKHENR